MHAGADWSMAHVPWLLLLLVLQSHTESLLVRLLKLVRTKVTSWMGMFSHDLLKCSHLLVNWRTFVMNCVVQVLNPNILCQERRGSSQNYDSQGQKTHSGLWILHVLLLYVQDLSSCCWIGMDWAWLGIFLICVVCDMLWYVPGTLPEKTRKA